MGEGSKQVTWVEQRISIKATTLGGVSQAAPVGMWLRYEHPSAPKFGGWGQVVDYELRNGVTWVLLRRSDGEDAEGNRDEVWAQTQHCVQTRKWDAGREEADAEPDAEPEDQTHSAVHRRPDWDGRHDLTVLRDLADARTGYLSHRERHAIRWALTQLEERAERIRELELDDADS